MTSLSIRAPPFRLAIMKVSKPDRIYQNQNVRLSPTPCWITFKSSGRPNSDANAQHLLLMSSANSRLTFPLQSLSTRHPPSMTPPYYREIGVSIVLSIIRGSRMFQELLDIASKISQELLKSATRSDTPRSLGLLQDCEERCRWCPYSLVEENGSTFSSLEFSDSRPASPGPASCQLKLPARIRDRETHPRWI